MRSVGTPTERPSLSVIHNTETGHASAPSTSALTLSRSTSPRSSTSSLGLCNIPIRTSTRMLLVCRADRPWTALGALRRYLLCRRLPCWQARSVHLEGGAVDPGRPQLGVEAIGDGGD